MARLDWGCLVNSEEVPTCVREKQGEEATIRKHVVFR